MSASSNPGPSSSSPEVVGTTHRAARIIGSKTSCSSSLRFQPSMATAEELLEAAVRALTPVVPMKVRQVGLDGEERMAAMSEAFAAQYA